MVSLGFRKHARHGQGRKDAYRGRCSRGDLREIGNQPGRFSVVACLGHVINCVNRLAGVPASGEANRLPRRARAATAALAVLRHGNRSVGVETDALDPGGSG